MHELSEVFNPTSLFSIKTIPRKRFYVMRSLLFYMQVTEMSLGVVALQEEVASSDEMIYKALGVNPTITTSSAISTYSLHFSMLSMILVFKLFLYNSS